MGSHDKLITRRRFLRYAGTFSIMAGFAGIAPAYALQQKGIQAGNRQETIPDINLMIRWDRIDIGGREGRVITLNGSIPGPIVRLKEGKEAVIHVTNELEEDTSIHWHGILLPAEMDGVPGVSFPGIKPGQTFTYRYPVKQSGTYWYHSHSGVQEQSGHYGPLIIDPAEPEPFEYDREYVVMLSDWTFEDPKKVFAKLKKMSDYYNFQRRTLGDFFRDISEKGFGPTMSDRLAWGRMRMSPTDIADVTGYTYTYLMNGLPPSANWTGLFKPGERIRLRFINGSAMSYFNVRIPGLKLSVIQSDGQNIKPVEVEEFQIAVAETYDVIVNPVQDSAYTIFAESMDRSGYALGTLATRPGMSASIPALRERPLRTMIDMGMPMDKMDNMKGMEMNNSEAESSQNSHHHHGSMNMEAGEIVARHGPDHHGPGNSSVAMVERNRLGEPGTGLEDVGHRVLVYTDLRSLDRKYTKRKPDLEIELHLTGNMEHYMWSFDGKKFSEVKGPIPFKYGERVRLTMVNDTMMEHPIHLHGMWMILDNGNGEYNPRKHTISVKPAERLSVEIDADAPGNWAFHCHLLYHMEAGMFRVVNVSKDNERITRK
jgi:CopA family copper-resistance protein